MSTSLKGGAIIGCGNPRNGEAVVINGRLKVKVVPRGAVREGIGESKLKGGIATHLEVTIVNGALKVKL